MVVLSDLADDERTARMVLSMLVEPNDPVTGRVMNGLGAMETLRLAERDGAVVGLSAVDAQIWRDHFDAPAAKDIAARLDQAQQSGIQVLVPGDLSWPVAPNDLGDLAPYVLWTRGASSFLSRTLQDFVTITGSRASTSSGDHVARELGASAVADERVVVAGGAYGIEGAAHQAALAAGGDTIAILANGIDRPYPAGHHEIGVDGEIVQCGELKCRAPRVDLAEDFRGQERVQPEMLLEALLGRPVFRCGCPFLGRCLA